jgi:hypothetical protein
MDQLVVAAALADSALLIDCRTLGMTPVVIPRWHCGSRLRHRDTTEPGRVRLQRAPQGMSSGCGHIWSLRFAGTDPRVGLVTS